MRALAPIRPYIFLKIRASISLPLYRGGPETLTMDPCPSTTLHFKAPASEWSQSLPIGNGRLGAMVYGRTTTELLQLNENSVWYGGPQDRTPRDALKNLPRLRSLIRAGNHAEAETLVQKAFFAIPHSHRHYEPLGTLTLEFGHEEANVQNYRRALDLATAVTSVRYGIVGSSTFGRSSPATQIMS